MKYSIRDLFLVTVIVALAVGWGMDRSGQGWKNQELQKSLSIQKHKAIVLEKILKGKGLVVDFADNDYEEPAIYEVTLPTSQTPAPNPPKK